MTTAYQNNDVDIVVTIYQDGAVLDLGTVSAASYKLMDRNKATEIASKALGSGIAISGSELTVSLTPSDTTALEGVYYHELQIVSLSNQLTVFAETITFIDTVI